MEIRRAKTHKTNTNTSLKVINISEELDKVYYTEKYVEEWKNKPHTGVENNFCQKQSTVKLPLYKEFEIMAENETNSQLKLRLEKIAQGFKTLGI